jgi:hypothetical protein
MPLELRDYRKLKEAAASREGILLLDGFWPFHFLKELVEELTESGVQFAFFFLFFSANSLHWPKVTS